MIKLKALELVEKFGSKELATLCVQEILATGLLSNRICGNIKLTVKHIEFWVGVKVELKYV